VFFLFLFLRFLAKDSEVDDGGKDFSASPLLNSSSPAATALVFCFLFFFFFFFFVEASSVTPLLTAEESTMDGSASESAPCSTSF